MDECVRVQVGAHGANLISGPLEMESDRVRFKPELGTGSNYEHRLKGKRVGGTIDAKL